MTKSYARRSSAQWQQIVDDQAESGLSAPQYCEQHQVSYASFSKWRQHFLGTKTSPDASHSDFIDLSQVSALWFWTMEHYSVPREGAIKSDY